MKQVYANLTHTPGLQKSGYCRVVFTARDWVQDPIYSDFMTGKVITKINIRTGGFWMQAAFAPESFSFSQNPKTSNSGEYYEIKASGLLNTYNYAVRNVLETLRNHELIVILYDKYGRRTLLGNDEKGMTLSVQHGNTDSRDGKEYLQLELTGQSEKLAPFYNPDNSPDLPENYLIDSSGNYLLVE